MALPNAGAWILLHRKNVDGVMPMLASGKVVIGWCDGVRLGRTTELITKMEYHNLHILLANGAARSSDRAVGKIDNLDSSAGIHRVDLARERGSHGPVNVSSARPLR
jgi:phosphoribosylformylglycinamidine (FGAM) synthase-like amidotransferase family enzyme